MRNDAQSCRSRLLTRLGILLITAVSVAHADPRPRPADLPDTDVGRRRFAEGVAALKVGKYEEARISFQQSYALKPAPAALRNLAATELKTGRYLDAARHFTTYLKTTRSADIDRADLVQKGLAEAKSHCGMLVVETNVAGAEIVVDGETIGRTPLGGDPWFVEPGEHVVTAHLDGYDTRSEKQIVDAGRTLRIFVALQPSGVATSSPILPDAGTAITAVPTGRLASSSEGRSFRPGDDLHGVQPLPPSRPDDASRVAVAPIAIGGAVTIAGLAVGIGYSVASSASARDRDALLGTIPGVSKCGSGTLYGDSCDQVHRLAEDSARQRDLATAGFVVAGVAGAATVVYWLWPRTSRSQGMVLPTVASGYAGFHLHSSF
jgi:hypothetical protein